MWRWEQAVAQCVGTDWTNVAQDRLGDGLFPLPTGTGVRGSQSEVDEVLEFLTVTVLSDKRRDGQDEGSPRFRHALGLHEALVVPQTQLVVRMWDILGLTRYRHKASSLLPSWQV